MRTDREFVEPGGGEVATASESRWPTLLSGSFGAAVTALSSVLVNLNLIVSFALLAATVSLWFDFRGAYTITKGELDPVASGLLPAVMVGTTVMVSAWCALSCWRYLLYIREIVFPGSKAKSDLKKLVPVIETCKFFLDEVEHAEDFKKHRLMGYINETGMTIWEELLDMGLDGPTAYRIQQALRDDQALRDGSDDEPDVPELRLLFDVLAPLARRGKTEEAKRIL